MGEASQLPVATLRFNATAMVKTLIVEVTQLYHEYTKMLYVSQQRNLPQSSWFLLQTCPFPYSYKSVLAFRIVFM